MTNIHPTAVVHPTAKIDPAAQIGPYAIIGEDAVIGAGTTVGAHAVVEFATLGKDNRLHPGCYVGTAPQDLKYAGEKTRLSMGDKNVVRECVTLNRGTGQGGETRIGSGCLFMAYSHVAHDCHIGNGIVLVNSVGIAGHVEIGDHTVVGGISGIHQFVRIGRFCMIGGGSMVGKDIPSFCMCQGDRATLRGLNVVGLRRSGLPRQTVSAIREAYRALFLSGRPLEAALAELKAPDALPEVLDMVQFIESSKRGVMRPATGAQAEEEVTL
ncbi:MAG TPA: acyl-ACP--UDP-N-acetylglucosamine O-acyltransferase [Elusimicrobiota bacterium]|jgi:UDP-N-acetylglucosamine acyltransferase|nr:acyl-ACP--UDP-N-acetylglucosamine O-acyltransferase [Elusimicrobiota bacterium]